MPNSIAITPQIESFLDKPLLYPVRIVAKPLFWVIAKIRGIFQIFIGYFVRIGVFSFAEWNRSLIKRQIINLYKGSCYDKYDPMRPKQAFYALKKVGGTPFEVSSKDGKKLDAMLIRYQDVKKKIEEHGGKIVDSVPISIQDVKGNGKGKLYICEKNYWSPNEYADMILPAHSDEKWGKFRESILLSLGLEQAEITLKKGEKPVNGFILKHWDNKRPTRPKLGQCFIRCNSPTESYPTAKRDIMRRVLGMKNDTLCFNFRGTPLWKVGGGKGVPTEGGYYLDAETMVEKAVNEFGYKWKDIWAEGFCLGGAVAIHLKKKYQSEGINLFVQNTFDKMLHTLHSQVFPASWLSSIGLKQVHSWDPLIYEKVEQDSFNSVGKLEKLKKSDPQGVSIIFNTDPDQTIHKNSHFRLAKLLDQVSKKTFSSQVSHPDPDCKNGHSFDIFSVKKNFNRAVTFITAKDYPEILNP